MLRPVSLAALVSFVLVSLAASGCVASVEEETSSDSAEPLTVAHPTPWSVSRHVWPSKGPSDDALLERDLDLIAELGAKYVRTDLWWYAIEPERGRFDAAALASYGRTLEAAQKRGLEVLIVLSNAPAWAKELYERGERTAFFDAFGAYAAEVAKLAGPRARYYQLWNEPNHVLDFVDSEGDVRLFQRGRQGIARGLAAAGVPGHHTMTMINVLVDGHDSPWGPSWMTDVDFYMKRGAGAYVDVIGIDHYPGTWSIGDWGGNILDRLGALGKKYGKRIAVLETGYATPPCTMPFNTEGAQARWIDEQLPRIDAKVRGLERSGVHTEILNWFKLEDRDTKECFDPENHFGIVRTDRSKKPAFQSLQNQIGR